MSRPRKTNAHSDPLPFELDPAVKRALKLVQNVIYQLKEQPKIPSKPPTRKPKRA